MMDQNITVVYRRYQHGGTKEHFINIEKKTLEMGLRINEAKSKERLVSKTSGRYQFGQNVTRSEYNFECVDNFEYLGATITPES